MTKHLYIRLDALKDKIVTWFNTASHGWSSSAISTTQSWIDKGLQPQAITRDLQLGVPIPKMEGSSGPGTRCSTSASMPALVGTGKFHVFNLSLM